MGFILVFHEDLFRTSQRRLTVTTRLILCRERVGAYCKSRSEHTNTLPGQNADFSVGPVCFKGLTNPNFFVVFRRVYCYSVSYAR